MVFAVLFGSRILPQAARRCAASAAGSARSVFTVGDGVSKIPTVVSPALVRPTLAQHANAKHVLPGRVTLQMVRCASSRGVLQTQRGSFYLFMWTFGFAGIACVVQEIAGPCVFFHE
eukprot:TRINITY_DN64422_c0_g1_i1.p1 TRINITY_DN64422_c0_g1~~TRINITY_DN64422_c0_g1_i1.p1  ORF type:complete len:136 (+),score=16.94 TRINITY_DN64422_c0_g1_i1:58-408(+)